MSSNEQIWINEITSRDRVVVTGASGWFGRTILRFLSKTHARVLAIGSREQTVDLDQSRFEIKTWSIKEVAEFEPTVLFDCAFLTRERLEEFGLEKYLQINQELISHALQIAELESVQRIIAVSSGAAVEFVQSGHDSPDLDPYGFLKAEYEGLFRSLASGMQKNVVISRAWSVSGALVTKPDLFAFTDLISQCLDGKVEINARALVYRRYISIEDFLTVSLLEANETGLHELDSGGELVELGQLAVRIFNVADKPSRIERVLEPGASESRYHSDNVSWSIAVRKHRFVPMNLDEQIQTRLESITTKS